MAEKKMKFEEALARLEEIVNGLEEGTAELEESLKLFEEGVKLVRYCTDKLDKAEQKVLLINGKDENFTTASFGEEEA